RAWRRRRARSRDRIERRTRADDAALCPQAAGQEARDCDALSRRRQRRRPRRGASMIKTVGVIGAGTMGNGIAQVFATSGFSVQLVDVAQPMLDRARATIEKSLGK